MQVTALSFWGHPGLEAGGCKSPSSEGFPSMGQFFPISLGKWRQDAFPLLQRMTLMCNGVPWAKCTWPSAGRQCKRRGRPCDSTMPWPGWWKAPADSWRSDVCWTSSHGKALQENSVLSLRGRMPRHLQTAPWALPGRSGTSKCEHRNCPMCSSLDNSLDILVRTKPPYPLYWEQDLSPAALPHSPPCRWLTVCYLYHWQSRLVIVALQGFGEDSQFFRSLPVNSWDSMNLPCCSQGAGESHKSSPALLYVV